MAVFLLLLIACGDGARCAHTHCPEPEIQHGKWKRTFVVVVPFSSARRVSFVRWPKDILSHIRCGIIAKEALNINDFSAAAKQ